MKWKNINKIPFIYAGLLILTAIVLYSTPKFVQTIFFLVILLVFWKTKVDYFWLAFTFMMAEDIGGAFWTLTEDIIRLGPIQFSFLHLFSLVSFVKYFRIPNRSVFLFKKPVKIYLAYLLFLMYLGLLIYGNEGGGKSGWRNYYLIFLFLITALNIFTVPKILNSKVKIEKFSSLIFTAIILNLFGQIFHLLNGLPLYMYFGETTSIFSKVDFMEKLIRPIWGHANILIGISLAMLFFLTRNKTFSHRYLLSIIFVSVISVFMGATRGWILAISFLIIAFLSRIKISKSILIVSASVVMLFTLLALSNSVKVQFSNVIERLTTLEKLAKGDPTAGGTNVRLTRRHDKVMEVFYRHPVIGKGFSTEAMKKNDMHVGNQNILMTGGIIGFLIIVYFWFFIIHEVIKNRNKFSYSNKYKSGVLFIIPILLSSVIIHSSSTSLYGYLAYVKLNQKFFYVIIFITILNQFLFTAISYERALKLKIKNYEGA